MFPNSSTGNNVLASRQYWLPDKYGNNDTYCNNLLPPFRPIYYPTDPSAPVPSIVFNWPSKGTHWGCDTPRDTRFSMGLSWYCYVCALPPNHGALGIGTRYGWSTTVSIRVSGGHHDQPIHTITNQGIRATPRPDSPDPHSSIHANSSVPVPTDSGVYLKKHYDPHCLPPVTPTELDPMKELMIQMMTYNIQYHKQLIWMII